ncbi:MAG TPA: hypothetical protein DCP92_06390 [Nitrospiraceae bacterium]|jgi:putative endonuclease|nr:hypothetical protein [Nitrospiraceae bacterium]
MARPNKGDGWCVYALRCRNNCIYIGITNDLARRLKEHENGRGSKFVRTWRPFEVARVISCRDSREARRLEFRLKRLKRNEKLKILGIDCDHVKGMHHMDRKADMDLKKVILKRGNTAKAKSTNN